MRSHCWLLFVQRSLRIRVFECFSYHPATKCTYWGWKLPIGTNMNVHIYLRKSIGPWWKIRSKRCQRRAEGVGTMVLKCQEKMEAIEVAGGLGSMAWARCKKTERTGGSKASNADSRQFLGEFTNFWADLGTSMSKYKDYKRFNEQKIQVIRFRVVFCLQKMTEMAVEPWLQSSNRSRWRMITWTSEPLWVGATQNSGKERGHVPGLRFHPLCLVLERSWDD